MNNSTKREKLLCRSARPKNFSLLVLTFSLIFTTFTISEPNKQLKMFELFYLPLQMSFREGHTASEVLPYVNDAKTNTTRIVTAEEFEKIEKAWKKERDALKKKSLLLTTEVPLNKSVKISNHITSYHYPVKRTALEGLNIAEQIKEKNRILRLPANEQVISKRELFLTSFLKPLDLERFNIFVFSASWCESCLEYRSLLESYLKSLSNPNINLHSIVLEDSQPPKIFECQLFKEIFTSNKNTESIPRFLAIEKKDDKVVIYEETEALEQLLNRFLMSKKGYLNSKIMESN
jgi:thiol-disulfide isomerase/thioredoxin